MSAIAYRRLRREELVLVRDIDRTERIDAIYVQEGERLEARPGNFHAAPWRTEGDGEHTVAAQVAAVEEYVDRGGVALGALAGERLVGIGIVVPHLRPGVAQLAYLHVSDGFRSLGVGGRLCEELETIARDAGCTTMVVSATPSVNTVRFYERRGFRPMAEPLRELYELEPEDVHLSRSLQGETGITPAATEGGSS